MKHASCLFTDRKVVGLTLLLLHATLFFSVSQGMAEQPSSPCPIQADIWVTAGQSNMESNVETGQPVHFDPSRMVMLRQDNSWAPAQEPTHAWWMSQNPVDREIFVKQRLCDPDPLPEAEIRARWEKENQGPYPVYPNAVGVVTTFAQHIVNNTDRNIGIIACPHGGTSITEWDPKLRDKGGDSLYGAMLKRIRMTGQKIKGILWIQGMADIHPDPRLGIPEITMEEYERRLVDLVDSIRRDTGVPDLPFIYVQEGRVVMQGDDPELWLALRDAQRRAMSKRPGMYMVSAVDLSNRDWCHYDLEGIQRIGKRMAEIALTKVYGKEGHGQPIVLESITLEEGRSDYPTIRLHFAGVTGRLKSAGRPADMQLRPKTQKRETAHQMPWEGVPVIYKTEFDSKQPADLLLRVQGAVNQPLQVVYGPGSNPYCNITDDQDIAVPSFGPIDVPMPAEGEKGGEEIFYLDQFHEKASN
jgi:sialate O-acetylesterase